MLDDSGINAMQCKKVTRSLERETVVSLASVQLTTSDALAAKDNTSDDKAGTLQLLRLRLQAKVEVGRYGARVTHSPTDRDRVDRVGSQVWLV